MGWQHWLDEIDLPQDHAANGPIFEFKSVKMAAQSIKGREATGIASTFNVVDAGDDEVWPNAYAKTIQRNAARIRFLWQHDKQAPPVAIIKSLREVGRSELPASILRNYPEATGGLQVVREYLDTPRANEILQGIKSGAITEMSIGYTIVRADFSKRDGRRIRNLRELELWDLSDVNYGMNPATASAKFDGITLNEAEQLGLRLRLAKANLLLHDIR